MSDEQSGDRDVLGNLPRARPARRSAKRDAPAAAATAKPKAPAKPKAAAKPRRKPAATPRTRPHLTPPPASARRPDAPPPAGYAVPEPDPHPDAGDLLTTAVRASVELTRLSISLGLRALRAVAEHRPRGDGREDDL